MSILKLFKKEKKGEKPARPEAKEVRAPVARPATRASGAPVLVLERPFLSEKAVRMGASRQYAFIVKKAATKPDIKKAVEASFSVKVEKVRIVNVPGKVKRLGRSEGWRPGYKKAMVTLKEGEKLELG